MTNRLPWSQEKNAEFAAMWRDGCDWREIAAVFGVAKPTISGRARRLGLALRCGRWTAGEREYLVWAWGRGIDLAVIGEDLDRTAACVNVMRRRMGLPARSQRKQRLHPLPREEEYERLRRAAALAGMR